MYRKRGSVIDATQMPTVFTATGRHGRARGMPGDWLCRTECGDEFVLDTPSMLLEYEPVEVPGAWCLVPGEAKTGPGDRISFTLKRTLEYQVGVQAFVEPGTRHQAPGTGHEVAFWWCGAPASEFEEDLLRLKEAVDQRLRDVRRGWKPGEER